MSGRGSELTARRHDTTQTLAEVRQGLHAGERLILLTGKVGSGKTSLCRTLAADSDVLTFVSVIAGPCRSAEEMLTQVLGDFGVVGADRPGRPAAADRHQLLITFQRFLSSLAPLGGRALVVVDEAHYLLPAVLEQIGRWVALDADGRLQIVLAGHPVLEEILRRPELEGLRMQVSRHCQLPDQVSVLVPEPPAPPAAEQPVVVEAEFWRVRVTGGDGPLAALRRGTPRLVRAVRDRLPQTVYEPAVLPPAPSAAAVLTAPLPVDGWARWSMPGGRWAAAAGAALVLIVAGSWSWYGGSAVAGQVAAAAEQPSGPAPAASSSASGVLPAADSVSVNIALFRSQQRATAVAAQLVDAGFPAFTRSDSEGFWHQVIVGPYVSEEEAIAAQAALKTHGIAETQLRVQKLMAGEVGR